MPITYITDKPVVIGKIIFVYHTQKESLVHPKCTPTNTYYLPSNNKERRICTLIISHQRSIYKPRWLKTKFISNMRVFSTSI